jgi:hypothetical protein
MNTSETVDAVTSETVKNASETVKGDAGETVEGTIKWFDRKKGIGFVAGPAKDKV